MFKPLPHKGKKYKVSNARKVAIPNRINISKRAKIVDRKQHVGDNTAIPFITITPDNGTEFANHQQISENIGCQFFFARPYRSSDRGLNEHINGDIRYFVPKKTDFTSVTDDKIADIQNNLNNHFNT